MLGATLVPISTWSRPRELEYVLAHCGVEHADHDPAPRRAATILDAVAEMGGPGSARLPRPAPRGRGAGGERAGGRAIALDDLAETGPAT